MRVVLFACALMALRGNTACSQKIDTVQIKHHINSLNGGIAAQSALRKIIEEDQQYRGSQSNDSLDLLHLIWVSCFVNRFGWPKKQDFGDDAFRMSIIWIHNHRRLRIAAFPIILQGFLSGQIAEKDLRDYYLRTIYLYKFDDDGYLHLPLKELFEKLELNTAKQVDVAELLKVGEEISAFKKQSRQVIGIWKSEGTSKTYDSQGKNIRVEFEGEQAELYRLPNGQVFLCLSSSYGSREPQELILVKEHEYRFKTLKTDTFYWVNAEALDLMKGENVVQKYLKIK